MVATGKGAAAGVLIKSAEALETAHKLSTVVLDKTGTITAGTPSLADVVPVGGQDRTELLRLVASAETDSEHPLATAIVAGAREQGLTLSRCDHVRLGHRQGRARHRRRPRAAHRQRRLLRDAQLPTGESSRTPSPRSPSCAAGAWRP